MKNVFWDFDGVILDSMPVREWGFRELFHKYNEENVEKLIDYHLVNGGLSRYVKIRYFFEKILNQQITEEEVQKKASIFSEMMRKELTDKKYLIEETVVFIVQNYNKYNFHIVSGSDQMELQFLCKELDIDIYFKSIEGSPTPKKELVKNLLLKNNYNREATCLVGDSLNDFEAASLNDIAFFGYNSDFLKDKGLTYIDSFKKFDFIQEG